MSKSQPLKIAVLGAGPIGLEAALYAKESGHSVSVFDAGPVAGHVEKWGFLHMFTPFGLNVTPLGRTALWRDQPTRKLPADTELLTGREFREQYLLPLAQCSALKDCVFPDTRVLAVCRAGHRRGDIPEPKKPLGPFRLLVRDNKGVERFESADAVLDCTGTFARPNWAGDGNIPALGELVARQQFTYWPEDVLGAKKAHYAGKSVAVIGGGFTAATVVCSLTELAREHQATWIVWLSNGPKAQPLPRIANDPLKERDRLAAKANALACRCDGNLEFHSQVQIDELVSHGTDQGFRITGKVAGKPKTWEVDRVIANVGYRPDLSFCSELLVEEPVGKFETGETNYFILGSKSKGRDGNFLLKDGHEQIRKVFALLAGKPGFDLYSKKAG